MTNQATDSDLTVNFPESCSFSNFNFRCNADDAVDPDKGQISLTCNNKGLNFHEELWKLGPVSTSTLTDGLKSNLLQRGALSDPMNEPKSHGLRLN
jgi:hypothetical protein